MERKLKDMTVGEIASTTPKSTLLFRAKNIDLCCSGATQLGQLALTSIENLPPFAVAN